MYRFKRCRRDYILLHYLVLHYIIYLITTWQMTNLDKDSFFIPQDPKIT